MKCADRTIIEQLQKQILDLQKGQQLTYDPSLTIGLGEIENAFPGNIFPRGAVHELISTSSEEATSTSGFISVIINRLLQQDGFCLWISTMPRRRIFPPALKAFGIAPERVLFIDTERPKETLWSIEEALKCTALVAVVGEITELSFSDSRRLQLAVESSQVTGFIHRFQPKTENNVACVSRWKIAPVASIEMPHMTGVGFPAWNVKLTKARNGRPGQWQVQWSPQGLQYIKPEQIAVPFEQRQMQIA